MKLHQGPVCIDGMVNSTEIVVHSKTNFVKVVQNRFYAWKPLMQCANRYCRIVIWPIVRLKHLQALVGPAYIQYCANIWLWKKFVRVGYHTICQSLKKIEKTLGISGTSIHSILHEHLTVKNISSRWIPHNMSVAQKKARIDWSKEMLQRYGSGTSKHVYDIVTGDESRI